MYLNVHDRKKINTLTLYHTWTVKKTMPSHGLPYQFLIKRKTIVSRCSRHTKAPHHRYHFKQKPPQWCYAHKGVDQNEQVRQREAMKNKNKRTEWGEAIDCMFICKLHPHAFVLSISWILVITFRSHLKSLKCKNKILNFFQKLIFKSFCRS